MRITAKMLKGFDTFILWFMLISVMALRWFNVTTTSNIFLLFLFCVSIALEMGKYLKRYVIAWLAIFIYYMFLNYFFNDGDFKIFLINTGDILIRVLSVLYLTHLMIHRKRYFSAFLKRLFVPLNIYALLNVVAVILQLKGMYWLAGKYEIENAFVPDLISGLLGYNGVHLLALFSAFIVIYNFDYGITYLDIIKRIYLNIYNIALLVFFVIISLYNDNKGYYFVQIFFVIFYAYIKYFSKANARPNFVMHAAISFFFIAMVIALLIAFGYSSPEFKKAFEIITDAIMDGIRKGNSSEGSSERIGMIVYILSIPSKRLFGFGVGNYFWVTDNALGFRHFGQSDIGVFMCLGGILMLLLLNILIFASFLKVLKKISSIVLVLILFNAVAVFTQLFTSGSAMTLFVFFISVCWNAQFQECPTKHKVRRFSYKSNSATYNEATQ